MQGKSNKEHARNVRFALVYRACLRSKRYINWAGERTREMKGTWETLGRAPSQSLLLVYLPFSCPSPSFSACYAGEYLLCSAVSAIGHGNSMKYEQNNTAGAPFSFSSPVPSLHFSSDCYAAGLQGRS